MNKKDAYYFSHDCNAQDDPKCMLLIDQLGMEGYGIFWGLIEKLRSEADYKLPLSVASNFARRWNTSKEKIETVIKNYKLFIIENDEFFSLRLMRSMIEKSEKGRKNVLRRWYPDKFLTDTTVIQDDTTVLQPYYDCNTTVIQNDTIKGKESKVKESKVKEDKEDARPKDLDDVIQYFKQKSYPLNEAEKFFNHYESNGWKVGKNPMKKWKNAAGGWVQRASEYGINSNGNQYKSRSFYQERNSLSVSDVQRNAESVEF